MTTNEYLERFAPEWLANHRAGNKRLAWMFLGLGLLALASLSLLVRKFADTALHESAWWWIADAVSIASGVAWLYLFIMRQVVYTIRTGDFR